jgi:hypothetical protein
VFVAHGASHWALVIVVVVAPFQVHALWPGQWDVGTSLPLQLCDPACGGSGWPVVWNVRDHYHAKHAWLGAGLHCLVTG